MDDLIDLLEQHHYRALPVSDRMCEIETRRHNVRVILPLPLPVQSRKSLYVYLVDNEGNETYFPEIGYGCNDMHFVENYDMLLDELSRITVSG